MRKFHLLSIACCVLMLHGCATLSKSECRKADWKTIGFEDGSSGRPLNYISRHRKSCAEHGVKPDLARYQLGHAEGVIPFCTPRNGFKQGNAGRGHNDVCPAELRDDFLIAFDQGRELYLLRTDIGRLHNRVHEAESELEELVTEIASVEALLVSGSGTAVERSGWLQQLKNLQYERGQLEALIHDLELDEARSKGEYDILSSQYQY